MGEEVDGESYNWEPTILYLVFNKVYLQEQAYRWVNLLWRSWCMKLHHVGTVLHNTCTPLHTGCCGVVGVGVGELCVCVCRGSWWCSVVCCAYVGCMYSNKQRTSQDANISGPEEWFWLTPPQPVYLQTGGIWCVPRWRDQYRLAVLLELHFDGEWLQEWQSPIHCANVNWIGTSVHHYRCTVHIVK